MDCVNSDRFDGFIVFDATDPSFYGGKLSESFSSLSCDGSLPWFFQPDHWAPNGDGTWYGTLSHSMSKVLMPYSVGYATREAAQAAASEWFEARTMRAQSESDRQFHLWRS